MVMVRQVVVDFGSQVNILPCETWISMGRQNLHRTTNYLKPADQIFIEPIGTIRKVKISIMGILMTIDFKVINLVDSIPTYLVVFGRPWGRRMKATISLEKDKIKLKGNGKKIIIPLDLHEGKPWVEAYEEELETRRLYQVLHEHQDNVEPNPFSEILIR